jgi:hypothetical protein
LNHPPTYVRTFSLHKVRENCHFLDHPPTLRSIKMAPYYDSYDSQTCLNLFRFNMIQIVPIHMILKHVQTCSDSICTYDAYCYDSYGFLTCLNLLCRECVRMGARTRRSFGHHLLHPQILTQQLFFEKSYSHRLQLISYIPSH